VGAQWGSLLIRNILVVLPWHRFFHGSKLEDHMVDREANGSSFIPSAAVKLHRVIAKDCSHEQESASDANTVVLVGVGWTVRSRLMNHGICQE
jgi:hypothetical protein